MAALAVTVSADNPSSATAAAVRRSTNFFIAVPLGLGAC